MTYEEYESNINTAIADPDTMLVGITKVLESLKTDLTEKDGLTDQINDLTKKITELRETNMKLYLLQTGNTKNSNNAEDEIEEKTGLAAITDFWDKLDKKEEGSKK